MLHLGMSQQGVISGGVAPAADLLTSLEEVWEFTGTGNNAGDILAGLHGSTYQLYMSATKSHEITNLPSNLAAAAWLGSTSQHARIVTDNSSVQSSQAQNLFMSVDGLGSTGKNFTLAMWVRVHTNTAERWCHLFSVGRVAGTGTYNNGLHVLYNPTSNGGNGVICNSYTAGDFAYVGVFGDEVLPPDNTTWAHMMWSLDADNKIGNTWCNGVRVTTDASYPNHPYDSSTRFTYGPYFGNGYGLNPTDYWSSIYLAQPVVWSRAMGNDGDAVAAALFNSGDGLPYGSWT